MPKLKVLLGFLPITVLPNLLVAIAPAQANCPMAVGSAEPFQLVMTHRWRELQQQTTYSWGNVRPYTTFTRTHINLTPEQSSSFGLCDSMCS